MFPFQQRQVEGMVIGVVDEHLVDADSARSCNSSFADAVIGDIAHGTCDSSCWMKFPSCTMEFNRLTGPVVYRSHRNTSQIQSQQ